MELVIGFALCLVILPVIGSVLGGVSGPFKSIFGLVLVGTLALALFAFLPQLIVLYLLYLGVRWLWLVPTWLPRYLGNKYGS